MLYFSSNIFLSIQIIIIIFNNYYIITLHHLFSVIDLIVTIFCLPQNLNKTLFSLSIFPQSTLSQSKMKILDQSLIKQAKNIHGFVLKTFYSKIVYFVSSKRILSAILILNIENICG